MSVLWSLTVREGLILCTKYALSKGSLHYSLGWFGKQELGWGLGLTSISTPVLLLNHKAALAFDLHRVWNTFEDTSYMSKYTLQTAIYLKYFLDMFFWFSSTFIRTTSVQFPVCLMLLASVHCSCRNVISVTSGVVF